MGKDHVSKIQAALQAGKLVVVVHGSPQELELVRRVMGENGGQEIADYKAKAA